MTTKEMMEIVYRQLAIDLNCSPKDFTEGAELVFCEAKENPGRRPLPRGKRHFEMYSFGKTTVVSATADLLPYLRSALEGVGRDDAFSMPFVQGQGLYFLPDLSVMKPMDAPNGYEFQWVEGLDAAAFYHLEGFPHAIQHDVNHPRPDALTLVARKDGEVVGIAGASNDCATMWQIGLDVLPAARGSGLAVYLTGALSLEVLNRGIVPYYGTCTANISSQRVAHKVGYAPAWTCNYLGRFDGFTTSPTG